MRPSKPLYLALLTLLPLVSILSLQDSSVVSPTALFKQGRKALALKEPEKATLLFMKARNAAAMDLSQEENANVLIVVEDEMQASNPLYKVDATTRSDTAKRLVGLARRYLKKNWRIMAGSFIEVAIQLDSRHVEKAGLAPAKKKKDKTYEIARHFPNLTSPWSLQGWFVEDGTYIAPWSEKWEISGIISPLSHLPGYRIEVEVKIEHAEDQAGVLIAYKNVSEHELVNVTLTPKGDRGIRLLRSRKDDKSEYQEDESEYVWQNPEGKKAHDWFTLIIEVRPRELSFGLDEYPLRVIRVPDSELSGRIGLSMVTAKGGKTHVRFRNFKLRRLTR